MIEAFEIGVSLALQDGISESIASAQQSVVALQAAIASSGVSIQALREAGSKAASITGGERDQTQSRKTDAGEANQALPSAASSAGETPAAKTAQEGGLTSPGLLYPAYQNVAGDAETQDRPQSGDDERAYGEPARIFISTADDAAGASRMDMGGPQLPEAPPSLSEAGLGATELSPGLDRAPSSALSGYVAQQDTVSLGAPGAPGDAAISLPDRAAHLDMRGGSAPGSQDRISLSTVVFPNDAPPAQPAGMRSGGVWPIMPGAPNLDQPGPFEDDAAGWPSLAPGDDAGANRTPDTIVRTTMRTASPRMTAAQPSAAPQGQPRQSEPFKGDVYLDGMLVGRWMSKYLRREAERADSGPTGFDAKRSRLLPGVTVGG